MQEFDQIKDGWLPLSGQSASPERHRADDPVRLRNWTLVLSARGIPFKLTPEKQPTEIWVPAQHIDIARHEISLFRSENSSASTPEPRLLKPTDNTITSLSVLLLLGIFHNLTYLKISGFGFTPIDWLQLGSADNLKIMSGEWWRVITALTLHNDGQHLLGNILIGGYFVVRLCQLTGTGLGWALILGSGVVGNLINAIVQNPGHNAVGASTAIFGAIGIAGALGSVQSRKHLIKFWILPLAAAGSLLGFLGAGSPDSHTDVGAHILGFLAGVVLGIPAGLYLTRKGIPGRLWNLILGLAAALVPIIAWIFALS